MTKAAPPGRMIRSSSARPGSQPGPKKYAHRACATSNAVSATPIAAAPSSRTETDGIPDTLCAASEASGGGGLAPPPHRGGRGGEGGGDPAPPPPVTPPP